MEKINSESMLRKAQALAEDIKEMESIDTLKAYESMQQRIKRDRRKTLYNQWTRYAAFLALPLLISSLILGYLYFHTPETKEQYAEITAATGSVMRYELPDQSVVWLNSGTTLRYPTVFKKDNRSVELRGEAYFEVQADRNRPFYVKMPGNLSVYVYGTKFNISSYDDEKCIETVLEKGRVNVITPNHKTIVLSPGEQISYNKESQILRKENVDVYEKVAWKDGKLIFRDTTLDNIFKRLSRHFNVEIQLNNKYGKEYRYRATFRNETLPQILDYLAKSAKLKWTTKEAVQQADDTFTKTKIIVDLY